MQLTTFTLLGCLLAAGCAATSTNRAGDPSEEDRSTPESELREAGRVGSHGMVLAGTPAEAFLSHIPMFQTPHDVQLVIAGKLDADAGADLPGTFSGELFTFLPDRISLDALRTGSLRELRGTIFLGNFESGGRPVASRVRFTVTRVVHEHVLDPAAKQAKLTYLVFGSRARSFAVHRIAGRPGFDEVLSVELGGDVPTDDELAAGVEAQVPASDDDAANRLGRATSATSMRAGARTFTARRVAALSCLEGPDFVGTCAE
ncbi:MAG TPA: hypothetical protein VM925_35695 [Labilithrix sp.]|nr:hypothetical protein [Labilithrix sp.]